MNKSNEWLGERQEIIWRTAVDGASVDDASDLALSTATFTRQISPRASSKLPGSALSLRFKPKCTYSGAVVRGFGTRTSPSSVLLP